MSHTTPKRDTTAARAARAEKREKLAAKRTPKKPRDEGDAQPPTATKERRLREKNLTEAEVAVVRALQMLGEQRGKRICNGELRAIHKILFENMEGFQEMDDEFIQSLHSHPRKLEFEKLSPTKHFGVHGRKRSDAVNRAIEKAYKRYDSWPGPSY